jgi:predicted nuclease of predicted toxin-antitoxin system
VKLLLDQNLSFRLAKRLQDLFPGTVRVRERGMATAPDQEVWDHATHHGYVILSKDADFHQRSFLYGPPPKVVWLRIGNCTTDEIEEVIRSNRDQLRTFAADAEAAFLALS